MLISIYSHLDAVRAVAFHPTELCLATGGDDSTVKIWRVDVSGLATTSAYVFIKPGLDCSSLTLFYLR